MKDSDQVIMELGQKLDRAANFIKLHHGAYCTAAKYGGIKGCQCDAGKIYREVTEK